MRSVDVRSGPARWSRQRRTLAVCIGAYFGVRFCQVVIGPVVPGIIATFGTSRGSVGLALTGMWILYASVQLPSGALADRFGDRVVVIAALAVTAGATLGLALAPAFPAFALAAAAVGVGAGIYYNPATTLLDRTTESVGRAIGTHRVGGQLAGIVAPVGAAAVGLGFGWRATVALGSASVAVVAVAFVRGTRSTTPRRRSAPLGELLDPELLSSLLARPSARTTTFMAALVEFVGLAAMAFVPTLLVEHHGVDETAANLLFAGFFAVAAVSQPLAGWLSDRRGRDRTIAVLVAAGAMGYAGLALGGSIRVAAPATALAGASMSATPVLQSRMMDGLGDDERGTGFGVFRSVYLVAGATGTAVVGAVADAVGWTAAFGLLGALLAVVLLVVIAPGRRDPS